MAAAVHFARDRDLEIAVRGGGHNVAGTAVCDDGIVIDLSAMRAVSVDPAGRTPWVQGGALWGDVDHATQAHGLATTGGIVGHTGVAGLTLGGGLGFLMRKHGLTVDNLRAAEVVTAEGSVVRASADENPDLFWALRGDNNRVREAYGDRIYRRLAEVKAEYDPDNAFHHNKNVRPGCVFRPAGI